MKILLFNIKNKFFDATWFKQNGTLERIIYDAVIKKVKSGENPKDIYDNLQPVKWGFSPTYGPRYREPSASALFGNRPELSSITLHPYETRKALEAVEKVIIYGVETVETELDEIPMTYFRSIDRQMTNQLRRPLV